jgi:hypothetical protein
MDVDRGIEPVCCMATGELKVTEGTAAAGTVAEGGGESSHEKRSLAGSGGCCCWAGENGEAPLTARMEGGIKLGGSVAGSLPPASFF